MGETQQIFAQMSQFEFDVREGIGLHVCFPEKHVPKIDEAPGQRKLVVV